MNSKNYSSLSMASEEYKNRKIQIALNCSRFLNIANNYLPVHNSYSNVLSNLVFCPVCNSTNISDKECNIVYCKDCSCVLDNLDRTSGYKDSDYSAKTISASKSHFIDAINQLECKQGSKIPNEIIVFLQKEIEKYGLDKKTVTKDYLYKKITENNFNIDHGNIHLIHYLVTGVPPVNITRYRKLLLYLFDLSEKIYKEIKNPDRKYSLLVHQKLYRLLVFIGVNCNKNDFFILKTYNKEKEHNEILDQICGIIKQMAETDEYLKKYKHMFTK